MKRQRNGFAQTYSRWQNQLIEQKGTEKQDILEALQTFTQSYKDRASFENLQETYEKLYEAYRNYSTASWKSVEEKYGNIRQCFDSFGQIKKEYRNAGATTDDMNKKGCLFSWLWSLFVNAP